VVKRAKEGKMPSSSEIHLPELKDVPLNRKINF